MLTGTGSLIPWLGCGPAPGGQAIEWSRGAIRREQEDSGKTRTIQGTVHGRTIELNEDLGLAEGQQVEVQVRVVPNPTRQPGEGLLRTEGALADDTEWDAIMEEIYQARKMERRPAVPDLGEA
jgi:hypothetical protein